MIVTIILCIHYVASRHVCMEHALKLLHQSSSDTIILPEVCQMGGFSNWMKIERMVSNYFCSCNLEQLKMVLKKSGTRTYTHTYTHTHTHMHKYMCTHTHAHVYTNFLDKSNSEKNQVSAGQVSLV